MPIIATYFLFCSLIFSINFIPVFMPATWMVLVFVYIQYKLSLVLIIILGAVFSTFGRIALYYVSKNHFQRVLPHNSRENMSVLGKFINSRKHIMLPFVLFFAFLPFPSNHVFIGSGLARFDIKTLALGFFVGRLINYSVLVTSSSLVAVSLNSLFKSPFTAIWTVLLEIAGFTILYIISKIGWNKVLGKFLKD